MDVLIVKNDIKCCNKLIKTSKNDLNVKFYIVSQYYEEIEMLIKKINFSMIIIDNELINLYKNIIKDYKKIIFILYVNNVKKIDNTKYYYIDKKSVNDEIFFATIEKLKYINTDYNLRIKIKEELKYLGYNPKYKGTQYIYEAILILLNENLYDYSDNLEKNVYPKIASKHNKSINTIKCDIINATDIMICECEENKLMEYLGYFTFSKPGPKKVIESIISRISNGLIKM